MNSELDKKKNTKSVTKLDYAIHERQLIILTDHIMEVLSGCVYTRLDTVQLKCNTLYFLKLVHKKKTLIVQETVYCQSRDSASSRKYITVKLVHHSSLHHSGNISEETKVDSYAPHEIPVPTGTLTDCVLILHFAPYSHLTTSLHV